PHGTQLYLWKVETDNAKSIDWSYTSYNGFEGWVAWSNLLNVEQPEYKDGYYYYDGLAYVKDDFDGIVNADDGFANCRDYPTHGKVLWTENNGNRVHIEGKLEGPDGSLWGLISDDIKYRKAWICLDNVQALGE
ncbi:MAG: hypothetical protein KBS83_08025, partial [Lachnospiraceae bacterium]|nr:hypothetical protein [Candidatus Equihabitans merdae]